MNEQKKPNLFIIGAPKCGTTSMIHYVGQHPEVFVSPVKEPHFFNTDSGHRFYFSEDNYLELFGSATAEHKYRCEGSVWYLYSKEAIDNILKFNSKAKFIIMLRSPVEMFFSLHQELLFGGSEDIKSAVEAWNLQEQRKSGNNIPFGCKDPSFLQYGQSCKLGQQVQSLQDKVSRENITYVLLDDLKTNPNKAYRHILKFLNINEKVLESYEIVNIKKVRKSYALSKFFIWFTKLKSRLGIKGGFGIATAINKHNVSYNISISEKEKNLLISELKKYFDDDICLLEGLINRDLTYWKTI